jgi:hypothetical protein
MKGYIGRPLDDTAGTVRKMMVNYHGGVHYNIREMMQAMPHADFIVFEGPTRDEVLAMIEEKASRVKSEEYVSLARQWLDSTGNVKGMMALNEALVLRKNLANIMQKQTSQDDIEYRDFLDVLALSRYMLNMWQRQIVELSAEQIRDEFPGRTELVKVSYPLSYFARDSVIALYDEDERVIIPSNQGLSDDLMSQIDYHLDDMADNPVWERNGYRRGENLNIRKFVGGNIVANRRYLFLGVNAFTESLVFDGEDFCKEEIERIRGDAEIINLRGSPGFTYHSDVVVMPTERNKVYVSDPIETEKRLNAHKIKTGMDRKLVEPFVREVHNIKRQIKSRGLNARSAPFWITTHKGYPFMLTYCNNIQESGVVYSPSYSHGENKRIREMGGVLDDWFSEMMSRDKEVVPIEGFDVPSAWNTGGIRCVNNVVWRE